MDIYQKTAILLIVLATIFTIFLLAASINRLYQKDNESSENHSFSNEITQINKAKKGGYQVIVSRQNYIIQ